MPAAFAALAAIDVTGALVSSAVVAAIVAGAISFLTQRYLLERKSQVDYEFMARKRLYDAIGPLRMQLLFASRDLVRRVEPHAGTRWNMNVSDHYGRSFIYRLLRPLTIAQLIERQMGVADFSVDPAAIALLRFHTAAERMLSGDDVVLDHPGVDWSTQTQHLFRDNMRAAAASLVVEDGDATAVVDYAQFHREVPDPSADPALTDLASIFRRSKHNLTENPLFWLRVVGYAYACNHLIATQGVPLGFAARPFAAAEMLAAAEDKRISSRAADYVRAFDAIVAQDL